MTKIIIDTSVFISALLGSKTCQKLILKCFLQEEIELFSSPTTLCELQQKISLKSLRTRFKLTEAEIIDLIDKYQAVTNIIWFPNPTHNFQRDIKDACFLDLARFSSANYLITLDKDLLDLKQFYKTKIQKPFDFPSN